MNLSDLASPTLAQAHAVAAADKELIARDEDPERYFVLISEEGIHPSRLWQVHYIPLGFLSQRGGAYWVTVEDSSGLATKFLYYQ